MKKYIIIAFLSIAAVGCVKDKDFLDVKPNSILTDEQVWQHSDMVLALLSDLYGRLPDQWSTNSTIEYCNYDEAYPSTWNDGWRTDQYDYPFDWFRIWDYGYIREINLFIQKCAQADKLSAEDRNTYLAEGRFLRAFEYFEHVKRMGGVPLILEPLTYDFSGDPTYLQYPRATEKQMYDFVISEMDTIKTMLPDNPGIKSRATKWLALAMKSRAALYAGSIAKYGSSVTPTEKTSGGEVGISAAEAPAYYKIALDAAKEIIDGGRYSLYSKSSSLSDNFASLFLDKSNNSEVIFAKDYKLKFSTVGFTIENQPFSGSEDGSNGGQLNPSLNLAMQFEKLDNTFEAFPAKDKRGNYIYYDKVGDIFNGRDARLAGTLLLPGSSFKGRPVEIWGGLLVDTGTGSKIIQGFRDARSVMLNGKSVQVCGKDGPVYEEAATAQTGFLVRKYLDPTTGSGQLGTRSEVWWVRYRYAEILLNAAEAAFELGDNTTAALYMNQVRSRAGLTTPLTAADITFDRVVHERKVEFAFEGHEMYDYKRWRLAHRIFNGRNTYNDYNTYPQGDGSNPLDNLGKVASAPNTMIFGFCPYKVYSPGTPNDGKWAFDVLKLSKVKQAHNFRIGNYYSSIADDVMSNNPKIVRNPNQ